MPPPRLTIDRLLGSGYFPEVLPPCFSTESFGAAFQVAKTPPADFNSSASIPKESKCARYNQARVAGMRRQFSIPNPVHFFRLAKCFLANWPAIEAQARKSPFSLTKPLLSGGRRCLRPEVDFRERPSHRARVRATARFILRTDIARFFPSIYTHSIPWAFHTKSVAKANYSHNLFGNALDTHFRNLQDKQTIGIPIGQDISRVIAEAILGYVEEQIQVKKWPTGIRCIDDYEIGFLDSGSAQEFLHKLQHALANLELGLNPLKTAILPLPQLLIDRWDSELRRFDLEFESPLGGDVNVDEDESVALPWDTSDGFAPRPKKEQLLLYFNKAIELQLQYRDEAVLRFSLKRLAHLTMTKECWPLYQDYLLHCALNQPETLRLVVSNLLKAVFLDELPLDKVRLKTVVNAVIKSAAPLGHSSDVAWALWAALIFKIKVSPAAAKELEGFQDSVVGCLSCEAKNRRLLPKKFAPPWVKALVASPKAFYGEHWLLAYEAARNGWAGANTAGLDRCFGYLHAEKVKFFVEDYADSMRKELKAFLKAKKRPLADDNEDDSDSEDAFDNWWFRDSD